MKKVIVIILIAIVVLVGIDIYEDVSTSTTTNIQQAPIKTEEEIRHEYYNNNSTEELQYIEYIVESEIVAHTEASESSRQVAKDVINTNVPYYQDMKQFCIDSKQYMEAQYGGKEYNEMYEYLYDAIEYIELSIDDYEYCINLINSYNGYISVESKAQEYMELSKQKYQTYLDLTGNQGYGMINN